jgi:hypothetical protein
VVSICGQKMLQVSGSAAWGAALFGSAWLRAGGGGGGGITACVRSVTCLSAHTCHDWPGLAAAAMDRAADRRPWMLHSTRSSGRGPAHCRLHQRPGAACFMCCACCTCSTAHALPACRLPVPSGQRPTCWKQAYLREEVPQPPLVAKRRRTLASAMTASATDGCCPAAATLAAVASCAAAGWQCAAAGMAMWLRCSALPAPPGLLITVMWMVPVALLGTCSCASWLLLA